MKQTRRMFSWLMAGTLALAMVTSLTAQSAKDSSAKVVRLKGSARYQGADKVFHDIKVGTVLKSGHLIQTAAGSYVDLMMVGGTDNLTAPRAVAGAGAGYTPKAEQDMIRVFEDTVLALDKLTVMNTGADQVTDTQLDLRSGKIFGSVKKLSPTSHYEIKLPNGVAGIRGTTYTISADGVIQVLSGSVVISWVAPDGTPMTQAVSGGNQFDTRTGLMTPIPESQTQELLQLSKASQSSENQQPISFVEDHTIYFVSPTKGP